jgi:hypothetical protein
MTEPGHNLNTIIGAVAAVFQYRGTAKLRNILAESVVWHGPLPHLVCRNRDEVVYMLEHKRAIPPRLTRIEAQEFGEKVAITVEGPDFPENEILPAAAPRSLVFTFRDGKVVRIESVASREEALELAIS